MTTSTLLSRSELAELSRCRGDRVINFFEKRLYLTSAYGVPFILRDWQRQRYRRLYGTLQPDGLRQYRRAFVAEGSKNGKTEEVSGVAAYHLYPEGDGVYGAEVYSAASSRGQATYVYKNLKRMIKQSPRLYRGGKRTRFYDSEKKIYVPEGEAIYQALSADADYSDGINPTLVIVDELHRHKNRDMWDMLKNKMGTRREPLIFSISTAGDDKTHFFWEEWCYAEDVAAGRLEDPRLFVDIRAVPLEADWTKEKTWHLANPALGDFLDLEEFRGLAREAQAKPMEEASFRRLRLNQWVQAETPWLKAGAWQRCGGQIIKEKDLHGRDCFAFLDMSGTEDFTAWALWFPDELADAEAGGTVICRHWIPQAAVEHRGKMRPQLRAWAKSRQLRAIEGDMVDQRIVRKQVEADLSDFHILDVGFDDWACKQLAAELQEAGAPMTAVKPYFSVMNEPTKLLAKLVYERKLRHDGDPILAWMAGNVVLEHKDNYVRPSKDQKKARDKIDGIFATIGAVQRHMVYQPPAWVGYLPIKA